MRVYIEVSDATIESATNMMQLLSRNQAEVASRPLLEAVVKNIIAMMHYNTMTDEPKMGIDFQAVINSRTFEAEKEVPNAN